MKTTFVVPFLAASLWTLTFTPLALAQGPVSVTEAKVADTFKVAGAVEKPGEWTVEKLRKEFASEIKTVEYTLKGVPHTATCIPILSVVNAAKPQVDSKRKNHQLAFVVVAQAGDGYAAAFSIGELSPDYGKRTVWIALDRDGKPLTGDASPVEILVIEDVKPSRWVHGVRSLSVLDTTASVAK